MIIVASKYLKARFTLLFSLILILSIIFGGSFLWNMFSVSDVSSYVPKYTTVVIDAGHGGVDGGTCSENGILEKHLNLQIALKVNDFLKSMGINTVMIRTQDISIHDKTATTIREKKVSDIKNRLKIINETENSIFVSIHQNHFSQEKYHGSQIFYSKNNPESSSLADYVRHSVISVLQPDNSRETKQSGSEIYLLYHAKTPSIMVECGFLSNHEETEKLTDENYQKKLAFLISLGVMDFINNTEAG
ncbi:MAG: N-acetylmuramoyl-L-alanine amidase [Clostridia bacterium]|nr:N-acetylmuramoyl-L-alanine amidase [Clostridia bacterium]